MPTHDSIESQLALLDKAFDALETALEATARILPTSEVTVLASDSLFRKRDLPESLKDPMKMLEWGRQIEARGLSFTRGSSQKQRTDETEFAMAARNGDGISKDLLERMHADRSRAEKDWKPE